MPRLHIVFVLAVLILSAAVTPNHSDAQVNIERLRKFQDGAHFQFGADFAFSSGNSDFVQFGTAARFDYLEKRFHVFTIGSVTYAESNSAAFKNRAFVHQRLNYSLTNRFVGELFGQIEQDEFVLLQLRLLGGAGIRFQIIDDEEYSIFFGVGAMVEHEVLDEAKLVSHPAVETVVRATNYISLRIRISGSMDIMNIVYVQPKVDDLADTRILNDGSLIFKISERVRWSNSILIRHDGGPPTSLEPTDISVKSGLTIAI